MRFLTPVVFVIGCGFTPPEPAAERDCEKRDVFFQDSDGDGFGADDHLKLACAAEEGWSDTGGDCDDTDASVTTECHHFDTGEEDEEDTGDSGGGSDTGDSQSEDSGTDTGDSDTGDTGSTEDTGVTEDPEESP